MEELMKEGYSLRKYNVCHTAQEKLRQAMGIMEGGDKSKVIIHVGAQQSEGQFLQENLKVEVCVHIQELIETSDKALRSLSWI